MIAETPPYCRAGASSNSQKYAVTMDVYNNIACWELMSGHLMWTNRWDSFLELPMAASFSINDRLVAVVGVGSSRLVLDATTGSRLMLDNGIWSPTADPSLLQEESDFNISEYLRRLSQGYRSKSTTQPIARVNQKTLNADQRSFPVRVDPRNWKKLTLKCSGNATYAPFNRDGENMTRVFVHTNRQQQSTACFDMQGRLVDYDEEAADTWLRYLGNGYPQPVEAAWLELDEMGRSLGPKKMRD